MNAHLVYDVGMNNGDDTAHYLRRGFAVVAIDADPTFIEAARQRFASEVADGRLTLVNAAVGAASGLVPFFLSEGNRSVWNSFSRAIAARDGTPVREVNIQCVPFRAILEEYGIPYYLKIDIEGADHFCLEALPANDLPQYVSFEASEGKLADLFTLARLGYTRFRLIDQMRGWRSVSPPALHSVTHAGQSLLRHAKRRIARVPVIGPAARRLRNRQPAVREAAMNDRDRPTLSSAGPMPDEVPGPWYTVDEIAYAWLYTATLPGARPWHDVHATLEA